MKVDSHLYGAVEPRVRARLRAGFGPMVVAASVAAMAAMIPSVPAHAAASAVVTPESTLVQTERFEVILDPQKLPARDLAMLLERESAVRNALETGQRLTRSFQPREALAEALAELEKLGVDTADTGVVSFDHLEIDLPAERRNEIQALPWVKRVRRAVRTVPTAAPFDSEGLEVIGSDKLNANGITGDGIIVAVIDDGFRNLSNSIIGFGICGGGSTCTAGMIGQACVVDSDCAVPEVPDEPQIVPFRVGTVGNGISIVTASTVGTLNVLAPGTTYGEHGTAMAEVVHEVAPDATMWLYGVATVGSKQLWNDGPGGITRTNNTNVTIGQIELAIQNAIDPTLHPDTASDGECELGGGCDDEIAHVIVIGHATYTTLSDPHGPLTGGTNPFTDDIDQATAAGTTVVVGAGNEAMRHYEATFEPCTECVIHTSGGICEDQGDDQRYHAWDTEFQFFDEPLNEIFWADEYVDSLDFAEHLYCYAATDAANPNNFEMELRRYDDGAETFPTCPRDNGMVAVNGTTRKLDEALSTNNGLPFLAPNDTYIYELAVARINGDTTTPKFRIACTEGPDWMSTAEGLEFYSTASSISDLGVVTNALTVGAADGLDVALGFEEYSGNGPTGDVSGPVKPDLVAPDNVTNFTTDDWAVSFDTQFRGTSASAAHVAGLVALLQEQAMDDGGVALAPATVKDALQRAAIPLATLPGEEFIYGAGGARLPDPAPGPLDFFPVTPCRAIDTRFDPGPTGGAPEPLFAGIERVFPLAGTCGVPSDAGAVSGVLTTVAPTAGGFATLWAGDQLLPTGVAAITFSPGTVVNNNAFVPVAGNETSSIRAWIPSGSVDLVFDINGYFK